METETTPRSELPKTEKDTAEQILGSEARNLKEWSCKHRCQGS